MREAFRNKSMTGTIRIKYEAEGLVKVWEANLSHLIAQISKIVTSYQAQNITLTVRQLYYQLVGEDLIPNALPIYKKISDIISDARYCGLLDWDAFEDRARPQDMHIEFDNISDRIRSAIYNYRLPRWENQDKYIELFCEKDALSSVLNPITTKYHIRLCINKGYGSSSVMYELSKRIIEKLKKGKRVVLLYVGDHDSSGLDMLRDIEDRITEFLTQGEEYYDPSLFRIVPVALTTEQVREYKLPPNPAKITDPRAKEYIKKFGNTSWEVDALKPEIMIQIVETAIQKQIDLEKYNKVIDAEEQDKKKMNVFGNQFVEEVKTEEKTPLIFDEDNIRTKIEVKKRIYSSHREVWSEMDKETQKDYIDTLFFEKGKDVFRCPICDSEYQDMDGAYNCVFEYHDKKEFDLVFNEEDENDRRK